VSNVFFELTAEFNARGPTAVLASGQAVVYFQIAIMSKDGDWILHETPEACARVLEVLARRGARYRPAAPLDVRWLGGGWSSHLEFGDSLGRRVRCDFLTRPPRVAAAELEGLFRQPREEERLLVIDIEPLIRMKRTQRAKDYAVIGELARLLPPARELELTTDPERILALAAQYGVGSIRPAVRAACAGSGRTAVVTALALEIDAWQQQDRRRLASFQRASQPFLARFRAEGLAALPLPEAHARSCALAEELLPRSVATVEDCDADAE
jgi:hypothetical protein